MEGQFSLYNCIKPILFLKDVGGMLDRCSPGRKLKPVTRNFLYLTQDAHTNSLDWSPYISFKNSWENLV